MKMRTRLVTVMVLAGSVAGQALAQTETISGAIAAAAPVEAAPAVSPPIAIEAFAPESPPVTEPAAAPGSRVAVSRDIINAAGAFDGYMRRATGIKAKFADGATVAHALALGSVYDPEQIEQGAVAYAALAAMQNGRFVQAVHAISQDPATREAFAARLVEHPELILDDAAAREEATRLSAMLGRMGAQLEAAGAAVKQAAYDVQAQDWSRGAIVGANERLARIKAQSTVAVSLMPGDTDSLINGLTALRAGDTASQPEAQAVTMAVTRGLALAALAVLGQAGEDHAQNVAKLMSDPADSHCIKMARLNLFQCLAVAGPHYEDLYCLGHHAMMDTGKCVVSASGASDAASPPMIDPRSAFVPVNLAMVSPPSEERTAAFAPPPPPAPTAVSVPVVASEAPANYSPYSGPTQR